MASSLVPRCAKFFGKKEHFSKVAVAMGGIVIGQAVVWYTAQFYPCIPSPVLRVDSVTVTLLLGCALLLASPFYVVFGSLSDRIEENRSC